MSQDSPIQIAAHGERSEVENGELLMPKFDANGLMAAVAQDAATGDILMLAWMNEESLRLTLERGEAVYWSRSRQEIWHKGATSGQVQTIHEILIDCDQDALILKVDQAGGGACHTGARSCFFRRVADLDEGLVRLEPTDAEDCEHGA